MSEKCTDCGSDINMELARKYQKQFLDAMERTCRGYREAHPSTCDCPFNDAIKFMESTVRVEREHIAGVEAAQRAEAECS